LIESFLRERQILAQLEHPQIARLLDGGRSADGLPFLVMDYVDGMPLDRWCALHAPGWRERLRLFASVCDTVDFAHRQLVVHRDLKPSNVLVTASGQPVLLDFGIAKTLSEESARTQFGEARAMTPRYASPEQLSGGRVGVASDVFSLGVLLFELLADAPPWSLEGLTYAERVQRMREAPALRAAAKSQGRLPDELDWICRRALAYEPAQRYRSAHALAADVLAVLDHRPVEARPDGAAYVVRKFLRRHWVSVAVAGAFAVLIAGFVWRLSIESQRTEQALAETELERDRAQRVAAFLSELFRLADTTQSGGREVSAREVLDRGRHQLDARTDLPVSARIALLNSLAGVYRNMGVYPTAVELLRQAQRELAEAGSPTLEAETLENLGAALESSGQHREARAALERALALRRSAVPIDALAEASAAERLGTTLLSLGERDAAGALLQDSYTTRTRLLPADDGRRAEAALRYGSWFWVVGQMAEAERYYGEALRARRAQQPPDLPELARVLDGNGALAAVQGRQHDAIPLYEEALAIRRQVLGDLHRSTADSLSNLGAAHFDLGDPAAAEAPLREALAIYAKVLPPESPIPAKTLNNLGLVRNMRHDRAEARSLIERALALHRQTYGDRHSRVAGNLNNLAIVAEAADDLPAAERALREAVTIIEAALGEAHVSLAFPLTNLARVRAWQGDMDEARGLFRRALHLRESQLAAGHPSLADTLGWFGVFDCLDGRPGGRQLVDRAMTIRREGGQNAGLTLVDLRAMQEICAADAPTPAMAPLSDAERRSWMAERGDGDRLVAAYRSRLH
jgi:serine/threonine-protein kinase